MVQCVEARVSTTARVRLAAVREGQLGRGTSCLQRHLAAGSIAVGDSSTAADGGMGLSEGWTIGFGHGLCRIWFAPHMACPSLPEFPSSRLNGGRMNVLQEESGTQEIRNEEPPGCGREPPVSHAERAEAGGWTTCLPGGHHLRHSFSVPSMAPEIATTESTEVTENPDPPARVPVVSAPSAPLRENSFEERACRKTPVLPFSTVVKRRVR
jgi:hypothetical protein